jgi:outer membrane protein assembly factor BamD (BamD/ComL family)
MDSSFSSSASLPPLQEHPVYTTGMAHMRAAQWQQAFQSFGLLKDIYPDDPEVQELFRQAEMRAALAQVQPRPSSRLKKRLNPQRLIIGMAIVVILTAAAYAAWEVWVNPIIGEKMRLRQITNLRQAADEAISAGDYAQARQSLQKLQAMLPMDSETAEALNRVEQIDKLSTLYGDAKSLMEAGQWGEAIQVLTELQSIDAQYRDLPELLQIAQESQALDSQFQAAVEASAQGDWDTAIDRYEALRQTSLTFRFEQVQAGLFEAHIKQAQALLASAGTDPERVTQVTLHLAEALRLRPMDGTTLRERHLAETYLAALNSANQDQAIDLLQAIYQEQPDYAQQEAAELLYQTLLKRADSYLQAGDETAAVADYQTAARLAVDDPSKAQQKLNALSSAANP